MVKSTFERVTPGVPPRYLITLHEGNQHFFRFTNEAEALKFQDWINGDSGPLRATAQNAHGLFTTATDAIAAYKKWDKNRVQDEGTAQAAQAP